MPAIAYGRQWIDEKDVQAVVSALKSDFLAQGPTIADFEGALAKYCGSKYAVAVANGTAGLHLACQAIGLSRHDEAITTPITFLATSNAILYNQAKPVFADIQYDSVNIDPEQIKRKITQKTKAILPVHMAGLPCDIKEISAIARKSGSFVIEDACHALGAEYRNKKIGACEYSDMTVFSFHPVKHITTGEGGCITTNNKKLYERLKLLRQHGMIRTPALQAKNGSWYYEMTDLGYNFRITDFQCALGISQLKKLPEFIKRRNAIAQTYTDAFSNLSSRVILPQDYSDRKHAWHLYLLRLKQSPQLTRRQLFERLVKKGIRPQVHYIPVPAQPYYQKALGVASAKQYPNAFKYYAETISLPMYPALKREQIQYVIQSVKEIIK